MLRLTKAFFFLLVAFVGNAVAKDITVEGLESININGTQRNWRIYVPPSYKAGIAIPLVLDFHGTGSSPFQEARLSEFEKLAAEKGFIVATLAAKYQRDSDGKLTWNVDLNKEAVDDVRFSRELINLISAGFSVDTSRIYATGFSGGGRMSSRLACDLSEVIAAIGPVAGLRYPNDCNPTRPVPVITFHGKKDGVNHYEHQSNSPPYWRMGIETAVLGWTENNQCIGVPIEKKITPTVTRMSYTHCKGGAEVVFYRSDDAGHTWPGSPLAGFLERVGLGKSNAEIPATQLIWEFFEAHNLSAQ